MISLDKACFSKDKAIQIILNGHLDNSYNLIITDYFYILYTIIAWF
jgi:hypothetical protein